MELFLLIAGVCLAMFAPSPWNVVGFWAATITAGLMIVQFVVVVVIAAIAYFKSR